MRLSIAQVWWMALCVHCGVSCLVMSLLQLLSATILLELYSRNACFNSAVFSIEIFLFIFGRFFLTLMIEWWGQFHVAATVSVLLTRAGK
jgi:hypothetical protein